MILLVWKKLSAIDIKYAKSFILSCYIAGVFKVNYQLLLLVYVHVHNKFNSKTVFKVDLVAPRQWFLLNSGGGSTED